MHIRFNRSAAVREGYRLYDCGRYAEVVKHCSAALATAGADPELLVLRGAAHLDQNDPNAALADWEEAGSDPHVGPVADYLLGTLFSGQTVELESRAWVLFERAADRGWAEGHIGLGVLLKDRAFRARDEEGDPAASDDLFRRAAAEFTRGLESPLVVSQARALSLRASVRFNLGDLPGAATDKAAKDARLAVGTPRNQTDPRTTGADLFR